MAFRKESIDITMKLVGTRLGDDVDYASGALPKFGAVITGLDAKF